jgi:hypothetical protein
MTDGGGCADVGDTPTVEVITGVGGFLAPVGLHCEETDNGKFTRWSLLCH